MGLKSPEEVPEAVKREIIEVLARIRGATVENLLWERLSEADRKWLEANIPDDEWKKIGPIGIWMKLRDVADGRAALDVALKCDLLTREKYAWLLREIGAEKESPPPSVHDAIQTLALVLIAKTRSAYWQGQEIKFDWENQKALWEYLWKLARAAKRRGIVSDADFGLSTRPKNLTDWKHRLTKCDGFPIELADAIESKGGEHRLNLSPEQVRVFE